MIDDDKSGSGDRTIENSMSFESVDVLQILSNSRLKKSEKCHFFLFEYKFYTKQI